MARPMFTDYLHSMRFHVLIENNTNVNLQSTIKDSKAVAGFTTVTIPELSIESVEYREGRWNYSRKMPGVPSMGGDISMARGVTRQDTDFWKWAHITAEGSGEYRADLTILHFHRDTSLGRSLASNNVETDIKLSSTDAAKVYQIHEAFVTRFKPAGDLDSSSSEISISELDCAYEYFEVVDQVSAAVSAYSNGTTFNPGTP